MKNWNLLFFLSVLAVIYFGYGLFDNLRGDMWKTRDEIMMMRGDLRAISSRLGADEREKANFYKLTKNQDVWAGTACSNCHNSLDTALPINKISISEAMDIVRNGNEKTLAAGMPKFSARGTRDRNSITDADLKVRLDALYTKELLDFAKDTKAQTPQPNNH